MNKPTIEERVLELAEHVLAETASDKEIDELESLMVAKPELRRVYLRYALLHGQLALTTAGLPETGLRPLSSSEPLVPSRLHSAAGHRSWLIVATTLAATILLAVSAGIYFAGSRDNLGGVSTSLPEIANNDLATGVVATGDRRSL